MQANVRNIEVVESRRGTYTILEVQSESNPKKFYRVDVVNGRCDCPSWKFSRGHTRICKHLKALGYERKEVQHDML